MLTDALVHLPAVVLRSHEEFRRWSREARDTLDARYRREQAMGTSDAELMLEGVCGACLDVAWFCSTTAGGEVTPDGRMVPNWRECQVCSCHRALNARQRGLLHCLLASVTAHWCPSAVVGPRDALTEALAEVIPDLRVWAGFQVERSGPARLPGGKACVQLVASADYLHHVGPLDEALAEVARVLVPGGTFLFSVPFYFDRPATVVSQALRHQFGWDILDRMLTAGFADATAHCYWSEELGYLGPFNMVFKAVR